VKDLLSFLASMLIVLGCIAAFVAFYVVLSYFLA
jgi:hypothetical protein